MGDGSGFKHLIFVIFSVRVSAADSHSLQYIYTYIRPVINFPLVTAVGVVDGEEFVYCDSNSRSLIPKTEWMKIRINYSDYWNSQTEHMREQQDMLKYMTSVMQRVNHITGDVVLQLMYSCEDNNTRFMRFGLDGEDLFSLDINSETWTSDKPQTKTFITEWDPKGYQAEYWKYNLETICTDWIQKIVSYSSERKVRPEASVFQKNSSSPEVVCHATGLFPRSVKITWQKDGEDVYEDVELNETLPNGDGSFQKRSILTVPAEELHKHTYTCVIQHSSWEKQLVIKVLEDGGSDGGSHGLLIGIIIAVVVGLVAVVVVVGISVWKKKNPDFRPVPPKAVSDGVVHFSRSEINSSSNKNGVTVSVPAEENTSSLITV